MKLKVVAIFGALLLLAPGRLSAQGLFEGFSFPATVTSTGQTELIGPIILALRQGTTTDGTLVIDVSPLRITNNSVTDIQVTPTGITVGPRSLDTDNSLVRIPVQAGATAGSIRVEGIRVAVAGTGITSARIRLYWETGLNVLLAGSNLTVIDSVKSGLTADEITDRFVIFNNQLIDDTSTITLREGFAAAFSSAVGLGQTVSTRVRIRVTDLPTNLQMVFPAAVVATNSGATLTTIGGGGVVLPFAAGSNEVIYSFAGAANSHDVLESFDIPFTVNLLGPVGFTQPTFEVSLAPIGAAVPDATFPSTDIPRYAQEDIIVQSGTSKTITKVLYWTGINTSLQNQIHIVNASPTVANLTIDGLNTTGNAVAETGTVNPVKLSLPANQSSVRTLSELFVNPSGIVSIRIQSTNPDVLATVTASGGGRTESVPFLSQGTASFLVHVVNENAQLHVMNPNSSPLSGTLSLRAEDGRILSTNSLSLDPLGSISVNFATAFNNPQTGNVLGSFSNAVVAFETFGDSRTLNMVAVEPALPVGTLFVPFFAVGSGFQTDISLINASEETVALRAQAFTATGTPVEPAAIISMPPREQLSIGIERVFSRLPATGYIKIQVPQIFKAIFPYFPLVLGQARIRTAQGGSTVIPLSHYLLQDAYIPGSGTGTNEFQGIVLVNPSLSAVAVVLQVVNSSGSTVSNTTITLNAGEVRSQLTGELFAGGVLPGSVIRVTASAPIVTASITGSTNLDALRSLPVLR